MVKVFTFVKNEQQIINDWLLYHSYIFGHDNIYVIDNMSTDNTHDILRKWKNTGVHLLCTSKQFKYKKDVLTSLIKRSCDNCFTIPLDCDEFIVLHNNEISTEKEDIISYIDRLPIGSYRYKFNQYESIPMKTGDPLIPEITQFNEVDMNDISKQQLAKTFYHSNWFISTDQGNHHGTVSGEGKILRTQLALLHYNIRSYNHFVEKTKRGAASYGHDKSPILKHNLGKHYHRRYWAIQNGQGEEQLLKEFNFETTHTIYQLSDKLTQLSNDNSYNQNIK